MRQHALQATVEAMWSYRPDEALAAIEAPLLILVATSGAADDEAERERSLALDDVLRARRAAGRSDARVVRYPGSGHNLMRYRPDEVADELLRLLAR
jgi:pimeloyl-ACP methyl ester carboxylesterase